MRRIGQCIPSGLVLLGTYKLIKAILLLGAGLIMLGLPRRALALDLAGLTGWLPVRLEPYCARAVSWVATIDPHRLEVIGTATLLYGLLYVAQSIGLLLRRRWGGYLVVVTTAFFIPFECRALCHRATPAALGLLLLNIVIAIYVIDRLRQSRTSFLDDPRDTYCVGRGL